MLQGGGDGAEKIEVGELLVFAAGGPGGAEAELVTFLEPEGDRTFSIFDF